MINKRKLFNRKKSLLYINKITKSMEIISVTKFIKYKNMIDHNNFYNNIIIRLMKNFCDFRYVNIFDGFYSKYVNFLYIIILTDKGFCGNLNINIINKLFNHLSLKKKQFEKYYFLLIGKKKSSFIKNFYVNLKLNFEILNLNISVGESLKNKLYIIVNEIKKFCKIKFLKVFLMGNYFVKNNVIKKFIQIFPLKIFNYNVFFSLNKINIDSYNIKFNYLFKKYLESVLLNSLLNNVVSENFYSMMLMKNAYHSSNDLYDKLYIKYNKLRQFHITSEIMGLSSNI